MNYLGQPRAIFNHNVFYFTARARAEYLEANQIVYYLSSLTYSQSVKLVEEYVQLVLTGLRAAIGGDSMTLEIGSLIVSEIVHIINTCIVRIQGSTPSEVLVGFNIRRSKDVLYFWNYFTDLRIASQISSMLQDLAN